MKLQFTVGLLILLLATCSVHQPKATDSGVQGQVTIGPMCPAVQVGQPCPDQPYQATLTVNTPGGERIARVHADTNGYFKVKLGAGTYILHPESPNVMPYAADQTFTVQSGQFTQLDIHYDSGIR